jgi:hypothetical protein
LSSSLVKKLASVMQEVKYVQKRGKNNFHGYTYATEADVAEKVREALAEKNVVMIPNMVSHDVREKTNQKGNTEYIVTVIMEFTLMDGDSGESIKLQMAGQGQDSGDKGIYKAITGAQKYAMMKAFMIPTGDDPEADESVDERNEAKPEPKKVVPMSEAKKEKEPPASERQINAIKAIAKRNNVTDEQLHGIIQAVLGLNREIPLELLSSKEASKVIDHFNKHFSKAQ